MKVPSIFQQRMSILNNSPYIAGITMLMLNVGSKYIEIGLSKTQQQALTNGIAREILIFSMLFMATKDVIISTLMTAAFYVLSTFLFNESSRFCICPTYLKKFSAAIDRDGDGKISEEELETAIKILRQARIKKNK